MYCRTPPRPCDLVVHLADTECRDDGQAEPEKRAVFTDFADVTLVFGHDESIQHFFGDRLPREEHHERVEVEVGLALGLGLVVRPDDGKHRHTLGRGRRC